MPAAVTLLLAATFTAAAIAKLRAPQPFVATVHALVPAAPAPLLARAIPLLELTLAALLVSGAAPRPAAIAALLLLGAFSIALTRLRRDPSLPPCACFGGGDADPGVGLARNALLGLAAAAALAWPTTEPLWSVGAAELVGAATVALGAICAWQLATALLSTVRPVRA